MNYTCTRCETRFEKGYRSRKLGVTLCAECVGKLIEFALPLDAERRKKVGIEEITEWDLLPDEE